MNKTMHVDLDVDFIVNFSRPSLYFLSHLLILLKNIPSKSVELLIHRIYEDKLSSLRVGPTESIFSSYISGTSFLLWLESLLIHVRCSLRCAHW